MLSLGKANKRNSYPGISYPISVCDKPLSFEEIDGDMLQFLVNAKGECSS